jgi:hypothetical protein
MALINGKHTHRFFTEGGILPPLTRSESSQVFPNETQSTIPYSEYTGRQIPVMYTNDPKSVYRWFSDNLPHAGCTIGFDVEVCLKATARLLLLFFLFVLFFAREL